MTMTGTFPAGTWELPEELQMLRETVAEFMRKEVIPREAALNDPDAFRLPPEQKKELQSMARELGLWCVQSPAEYGGAGLSLLAQCVVAEETAKCRMGAYVPACEAFGWDPPNVIFKGAPDQIERYGARAVAEAQKTYVAISEPSAGADPRSMETTARKVDGGWLLNGTKLWISGADTSAWGIVFAVTGRDDRGRPSISSFIVEPAWEGFEWHLVPVIRPWYPCELVFRDCFVPDENLLGEEGRGFALAQDWLIHGRVPYAAATLGIAQEALRLATEYAKDRHTFGKPLAARQAVQWMLADSEMEIRAARLLVYAAAWKADRGEDYKVDASIAKVYGTETAGRVVDRCIQVLGGMGVSKEMPLERWYREMRIKRIGEGPSEIHRMVVARDMLGAAAKG